MPAPYYLNGERKSIPELAEAAGCGTTVMKKRLRTMTPEVAVALGARAPMGKRIQSGGEILTVAQLAERAGVSRNAMVKRLRKGLTPAEAARSGPREKRIRVGQEYLTLDELADRAGCSRQAMKCRLQRGAGPTQAIAQGPVAPRGLTAHGVTHRTAPPRPAWKPPKPQQSEAIIPRDVKRTICPAFVDTRYKPERVESYFSALTPGSYPPSDSHMAKVYA